MAETRRVEVDANALAQQEQYMDKVAALNAKRFAQQPPLAFTHSFGCQQNVSDGERLDGMLARMGFGFTDQVEKADLVLYNTCAVREHAQDRVFGNVGALKHQKERNPNLIIALCGCMVQQEHVAQKIYKSYPYVSLAFGTHALYRLPELLYRYMSERRRVVDIDGEDGEIAEGLPVRYRGGARELLPVMYGCNNFCSYCIVPYVRGRERSRRLELVLDDARELIAHGAKEIMLLGQNVNSYGKDLADGVDFADLLRAVNDLPGDFLIRFMTSHPKDATRKLIDTMASCEKVERHLHLPFQAGSDRILRLMNRKYTREQYLELVRYARERMPDLSLTSDIIVGFPGETHEEFLETVSLVQQVQFDSLFTFIFSPRKGTRAYDMEDPVPRKEKGQWIGELLEVQEEIALARNREMIGKTVRVLVDEKNGGLAGGRDQYNRLVAFEGDVPVGEFALVTVTGANARGLDGVIQKGGQ